MTCQLRGDEAELFLRYGDWLLRVTRLRLQCSEAGRGRLRPRLAAALPHAARAHREPARLAPDRRPARALQAAREGRARAAGGDVCRQEQRQDGGGKPVPLSEILEAAVDVELAVEAREALRALAGSRWRRRRVLELRLAGYSYKEIARMLGVTYTNVNRHVTEGNAELRRLRDAA
jgi:DNA-directed RNA polymerase specialized sigma24 family protein